jgi:hypothetical protein
LIDTVLNGHAKVKGATILAEFDLIVDVDTAMPDRFQLGARHSELSIRSLEAISAENQSDHGTVKAKFGGEDAFISEDAGIRSRVILQEIGIDREAFGERNDLLAKGPLVKAGSSGIESVALGQRDALTFRKEQQRRWVYGEARSEAFPGPSHS